VAEGKFRQDLLYRLNVVPIEMPSLRDRAADIPLLVEYFIDRFGKKAGKKLRTIDRKTLKLFQAYDWPGNVRELQNVIERAVILSDGDAFSVDETWLKREALQVASPRVALNGALLRQEKEMIEAALAESHGRISGPTGAAANLGLPTRTLDSKVKRLGINKYRFKVHRLADSSAGTCWSTAFSSPNRNSSKFRIGGTSSRVHARNCEWPSRCIRKSVLRARDL